MPPPGLSRQGAFSRPALVGGLLLNRAADNGLPRRLPAYAGMGERRRIRQRFGGKPVCSARIGAINGFAASSPAQHTCFRCASPASVTMKPVPPLAEPSTRPPISATGEYGMMAVDSAAPS